MALVFQYGSNMSSTRLNDVSRLAGEAKIIGPAITAEEYELVFDIWSDGSKCAAGDIIHGSGRTIWGVVYAIPDNLLQRIGTTPARPRKTLDEIEGRRYRRTTVTLRRPDRSRINEEVWTYVGKEAERDSRIRTSFEYVKHYFVGVNEHDIPNDYVDYVRSTILKNNPCLESQLNSCNGAR